VVCLHSQRKRGIVQTFLSVAATLDLTPSSASQPDC
jgi:hypothetical protein